MSRWISKQNLKANVKHECQPPRKWLNLEPKGGLGSIWQCDCGKKWEVMQDIIAYYPEKPNKPVLDWGRHGKKEFGLKSALIKGEK